MTCQIAQSICSTLMDNQRYGHLKFNHAENRQTRDTRVLFYGVTGT